MNYIFKDGENEALLELFKFFLSSSLFISQAHFNYEGSSE